ncbi:hypothetical protein SDRG_14740 [Saprolegnia diclina VS20]|uniref:Uncharacterized protein n=1 Tax=Saprolegnia diclina (strain VS20) TaxID=1156394 RepID=T0PPP0_SAPDV|nr:hypothetical protein SDRG_14740 [Saprolegnia diclina VS20]EQC27414.1 hypothetical protein SDRG_14740 [Saprolegnia diclina VS20]|eukprot:XP_008619114.1 hypothetical protein SDRG_14740 [Saprolegnia diclina VS20]
MGETDEPRAELWPFVCLALQLMLSNVARFSLLVIDAAFVGHIGTNELAGASLAMLWIDFPLYTVWGLANALVVLCGQAYGAKNGILMGIWLQMALVLVTLLAVPTTIYCLFLHDMLRVASDDSAIVALGARFGALLSPSMWPLLAYVCLRQYLQAMGVVAPTTLNAVVAVGLDIGANYVLIEVAQLGFDGSPLATVLVAWLQPIALYLYAFEYKKLHRDAWGGWKISELTRQRWTTFLQIALPLGLNDGCDLLATAALSLVVARISTEAMAAHAILSNVWTVVDAIYYGIGLASEVGLATHLGGGRPEAARACARRGVAVLLLTGALVCLGLWLSPARIVGLFTPETSLLIMYTDVLPLLVLACGLRSLEVALVTTLEGLCQMRFVTIVTIGGLWGVELPLAYYCGLHLDLGLPGVWVASTIAVTLKTILLGLRCLRIDWASMATEAMATAEARDDSSTDADSTDSICLVVTPVHEPCSTRPAWYVTLT